MSVDEEWKNFAHDDAPCNKNGGPRDGDKESTGGDDVKGGEEGNEEGVRAMLSRSRDSNHGNREFCVSPLNPVPNESSRICRETCAGQVLASTETACSALHSALDRRPDMESGRGTVVVLGTSTWASGVTGKTALF